MFVVQQGLRSLVVPFLAGGSSRRLLSRYRKLGAVLGTAGLVCSMFSVCGLGLWARPVRGSVLDLGSMRLVWRICESGGRRKIGDEIGSTPKD